MPTNQPSLFELDKPEAPVACSQVIRVALESGADTEFSYLYPDELPAIQPGQRVDVPFGRGNRLETGFCVDCCALEIHEQTDSKPYKLKMAAALVDKRPLLNDQLMDLARWISRYYVCPLGQVLSAMVPGAVKRSAGVRKEKYIYLEAHFQDTGISVKGIKQKQILTALAQEKAFDKESAIRVQDLLQKLSCTTSPLKGLTEKRMVHTITREVLATLPSIPGELLVQEDQHVTLNEDQEKALEHIIGELGKDQFGVSLLYGVTGSGKTEVYIHAIHETLKRGKGAIVLLPEIALTAQTVQRFKVRYEHVAVLHSGLNAAQRHAQWQSIRSGEAKVVVGARSAVFAPLPELGLIVVDEEHESSYKQDSVPRYHGRDLAIKRCQLAEAHCILGSATPSLETVLNCKRKKGFTLVGLPKRVKNLPMPTIKLVDLREEPTTKQGFNLMSVSLTNHLRTRLEKKEQSILLLNRRGYSNFVFCPACKHSLQCRNCDVTLTFHKRRQKDSATVNTVSGRHLGYGHAICHYCQAQTLVPSKCPICGKKMIMIGLGSQRLEEELLSKLPEARIARIDSDSMANQNYYQVLKQFGEGHIDILAGTQMLAKGLHFPNVTLVGVISADTALYLPDFRSGERTYQLISQVAGRAGRDEKEGTVIVQTIMPQQPSIQYARNADFKGFVDAELKQREQCHLPPYTRMASVVMRDEHFDRLENAANQTRQRIDLTLASLGLTATVQGPVAPPISRIQRFHRLQIVVQAPNASAIQTLFGSLRAQKPIRPTVKTVIDIDPVNLI
jgi:primosomal protein N' (replication factor Y) (superfamily II helicase)